MADEEVYEYDTDRPMYDRSGVRVNAGDKVAFDDDPATYCTVLGWYGDDVADGYVIDHPEEGELFAGPDGSDVILMERVSDKPQDVAETETQASQSATAPTPQAQQVKQPANAMVTQATPDTLLPGMIVLPHMQPQRRRRAMYRPGRLWVVAAYLKQTNAWKLHPVNGDSSINYWKTNIENLQIVKVKGEM